MWGHNLADLILSVYNLPDDKLMMIVQIDIKLNTMWSMSSNKTTIIIDFNTRQKILDICYFT